MNKPDGCIEIITIGTLSVARVAASGGQVVKILEPADLDSDYTLGYRPVIVHLNDADATAEMVERIVTAGFHINLPPADVVKYTNLVEPLRVALLTRAETIKLAIYWMEHGTKTVPVHPDTRNAMNRCYALHRALCADMRTTS